MTKTSEPDIYQQPEMAQAIVNIYDVVLNRNPVAEELHAHMQALTDGMRLDELFQKIAGSDEASERFLKNPNFHPLINNLFKMDGQPSAAIISQGLPWKAEDRPLHSDAPIRIMQIELTNDCPFKCVMCPRTEHMTRAIGMMEFATFTKIIDELASIHPDYAQSAPPIWLHHFGESLVHPEFSRFMKYAKSCGIPTALSINPLMLTERIAEDLLDAAPAALLISLDGHDDASFLKIRGLPNAYERSKERLIRFLQGKVERGLNTHITLSIIDFILNGRRGDETRESLENFWKHTPGIDTFLWKPYDTSSGEIDQLNQLASPTEAVKLIRHYRNTMKVTCDFPWRRVVIAWNGDVLPCCHDYDAKVVLGNVNTQSLQAIWNGEKMKALRQEFISGQIVNPICQHCEHRYKNNPRDD